MEMRYDIQVQHASMMLLEGTCQWEHCGSVKANIKKFSKYFLKMFNTSNSPVPPLVRWAQKKIEGLQKVFFKQMIASTH